MRSNTIDPLLFALVAILIAAALCAMKIANFLGSDYMVTLAAFAKTAAALIAAFLIPFMLAYFTRRFTIGLATWISYLFWFPVIKNIAEKQNSGDQMLLEFATGGLSSPWWSTDAFLYGSWLALGLIIVFALKQTGR